MDDDLGTPFRDFVELFERLGIPYALIGGLAVSVHGIPRPTHDLDFTIALDRGRIIELFDAAIQLGYTVSEEFARGWVDQVGGMPLVRVRQWLRGRSVDIDIFLAETRLQESLLARRSRLEVDGVPAWVVSPEDLILLKLIASRPRDIGDVMDILMAQGQLDEEYLRRWATELGLLDALNRVKNEMPF